mgnify:CR=1 FL=1
MRIIISEKKKLEDRFIKFTRWIGSVPSVLLHTAVFLIALTLPLFGIAFEKVLLVITTIVSLEAIYLSLFIQMTVNFTTESLQEVEHDIDEIQEDIDELQEDVEEIEESDDEEAKRDIEQQRTLADIQNDLRKLMADIEKLQQPRA